ncbi:hypothetical protein D9758_018928 [Tetrapyrgos nigripes]|uniref:Lysine-specific metallo-endopeptidase domain-containing protein n=1 Tax=Tetrapyrgos nigripes TaxID=182062 RepID=A0A8H5BB35_9AGAR|nr:hypothetical protein D9758_018928 [Tetrapyrgos nigripes]
MLSVLAAIKARHRRVSSSSDLVMFSSTLRSTLIALCFSAVISAASELTLKVTGPEAVTNVDNFKVTTLLTNSGDETLHLLNDPTSSLISSDANSFRITNSKGASPAFNSAVFKFSPAVAAKMNTPDVITVIPPGQSIKVEHDLSSAYNFTSSGEDVYDIEASNKFFVVDPATLDVTQIYAKQESSHQAKLSGTLSIARRTTSLAKRANFKGCSADQQSNINKAIPAMHETICETTHLPPTDTLTGSFWRAPNTGQDSRAGTLVHKSSHFTALAGTQDYAYGHPDCEDLAASDPGAAVNDADSHEYFVENINPTLN